MRMKFEGLIDCELEEIGPSDLKWTIHWQNPNFQQKTLLYKCSNGWEIRRALHPEIRKYGENKILYVEGSQDGLPRTHHFGAVRDMVRDEIWAAIKEWAGVQETKVSEAVQLELWD